MRDIFEGIQAFFEDFAFAPLNYLRDLELEYWWLANLVNWLFVIIGIVAFAYWMKQLKKFHDNNEDRQDTSAHSYLG